MSRYTLNILVVSLVVFAASSIVFGQSRVYVSDPKGNDINPCSSTLPCRTITKALTNTTAGGEVIILDSGQYPAFIITKSVSIIAAPGIDAEITASSSNSKISIQFFNSQFTVTPAIQILNAPIVVLSGLRISQGLASPNNPTFTGILYSSGSMLQISNSSIQGLGTGILATNTGNIVVNDTTVSNSNDGISVFSTGTGKVTATINHSRFIDNGQSVNALDNSVIIIRDSITAGNSNFGFSAITFDATKTAEMNVENCMITTSLEGIVAGGNGLGGTIRVSNSTITNNSIGLVAGGKILTRGNNTVEGNTTLDGNFSGAFSVK